MATFRTRSSGTVEACIRRKHVLSGPIYLTFPTIEAAKEYCAQAEALIDSGKAPAELLSFASEKQEPLAKTVKVAIAEYLSGYHVTDGDKEWLNVLSGEIGATALSAVTVQWALGIIKGYKLEKQLAPTTIRHRIGALRRCLDWHVVTGSLPLNPLKLLPERYATYNEDEQKLVEDAPPAVNDRERRLEPGEEEKIRRVLKNDPDYIKEIGVERGIKPESEMDMTLLFDLALETAMRMREMFSLTIDQIDLSQRTIFLNKTKNGSSRQVPLSSVALARMGAVLPLRRDILFPTLWNGKTDKATLKATTNRVSKRWATIAALAKCDDLHFHDLRHEATSRLFERTSMSDTEIAKITGHKDPRMLARYANLRASNLAHRMW